ncbi:MAG: thiamine phosphate synthase [Chromatiales bacterium]|jgi:thiamine-phosphate pyrophosphorylase|nr:thiamine phosphate synthase [Chromatiales bacterium]MDX9766743.1 thiamine phosphate synthase [Ectothiorhodospiraceae bacterium]
MPNRRVLRGLYAITDPQLTPLPSALERIEQSLRGGARLLQYRDKGDDHERRLREALSLRELCHRHGAQFIVNDDVRLAHESGADGVHLGRDDVDVATARGMLGADAIIGVSCYDRLELALAAAAGGADYVAFGSFYPSGTKPAAVRADPSLIAAFKRQADLPVCAIGGITPDNAPTLIAAGADMLAVIGGLFAQADVEMQASRITAAFDRA